MEQDVYLDTIHLDRSVLRESVTDESVKMLADSIREHGLLQAIVVSPRDGGGYRLIAGRRRLTACRLLGYTTIAARIMEMDTLDELPALAENLMRLNMNPLEEALAVKMLHQEKNLSIAAICERTNHGTSWVQDRLALAAMPALFQQAVAQKKIGISAAMLLLQIQQEDYRDYLLGVAKINGATVHQCEAWLLDYQARSRLTNPTGQGGPIPQLPLEVPEMRHHCDLCRNDTPMSRTQLMRVCYDCGKTLAAAADAQAREEQIPAPPIAANDSAAHN